MPAQGQKGRLNLVSFDLSLTGTGTVSYSYRTIQSPATLTPPKGLVGVPRLDWILRQCHSIVPAYSLVIFEDLAFNAHDRNHERAGLATLVRWMLWRKKTPYILVAPTTLKKFGTGSGKGDKSRIQLEVYKRWHVECADDNQADAYILLRIGMALMGLDKQLTKPQLDCLATIRKSNAAALDQL